MLPTLLAKGGVMIWLLLLISAVGIAVFIERLLHYHRAQINSSEFINGVRNVLNRERGRDGVREALEEAGLVEVPRLEEKLNVLATIAQIAPLMGFLGTVLGFIRVFTRLEEAGLYSHMAQLSDGVWQGLLCTAMGLAIAIP